MSYSVNDQYYEDRWNAFNNLTDLEKIEIALRHELMTDKDIEDSLYTSEKLTDLLHDSALSTENLFD